MKSWVVSLSFLIAGIGLAGLLGCKSASTDSVPTAPVYDPRIPGGIIGESSQIKGVTNFVAIPTNSAVSLTWNNPMNYEFLDFNINVYRRDCKYDKSLCELPDPSGTFSSANSYRLYRGKLTNFIDTSISANSTYTYWACVSVGDNFGQCVRQEIETPQVVIPFYISPAGDIWRTLKTSIGQSPNADIGGGYTTPYSAQTIDAGPSTTEKIAGRLAINKTGTIAYYAETKNNRIVVYAKLSALACETLDPTKFEYSVCLMGSAGDQFTPVQVLGQPNQRSKKSCQEHLADRTDYGSSKFVRIPDEGLPTQGSPIFDKCLTAPTSVVIDGNNLVIGDAGNNRIVVHKGLPVKTGCDTAFIPSQPSVENCSADLVIGKRNMSDLSAYPMSTHGRATFNNPSYIQVRGGDLFVLDQGNHRIVRVRSYLDPSSFNCSDTTFNTPACRFTSVLGQPDFFSRENFFDLTQSTPGVVGDTVTMNKLTPSYQGYLKRHFGNPTTFKFTEKGELLVAANENYKETNGYTGNPMGLEGRILVFNDTVITGNNPTCTAATFANGGCDAKQVIGQLDPDFIPLYSQTTGSYIDNVRFGLPVVSELVTSGNILIASLLNEGQMFVWNDFRTSTKQGIERDIKINNPSGAPHPDYPSQSLPDLKTLNSIVIDETNLHLYVSDPENSKFYSLLLRQEGM